MEFLFFFIVALLVTIGLSQDKYLENQQKSKNERTAFLLFYMALTCYILIPVCFKIAPKTISPKIIFWGIFMASTFITAATLIRNKSYVAIFHVISNSKRISLISSGISIVIGTAFIHPATSATIAQLTGAPAIFFTESAIIINSMILAMLWLMILPLFMIAICMIASYKNPRSPRRQIDTITSTTLIIGFSIIYIAISAYAKNIFEIPLQWYMDNHFESMSFHKNEKINLKNSEGTICKNLSKESLINLIDQDHAVVAKNGTYYRSYCVQY